MEKVFFYRPFEIIFIAFIYILKKNRFKRRLQKVNNNSYQSVVVNELFCLCYLS